MTKEERKLREYIKQGTHHGIFSREPLLTMIIAMRRAIIAGEREMFNIMRRAVIAQERERCAKYIETYGRGKCISEASSEALADEIRRQP